jgi:hypothetical protein
MQLASPRGPACRPPPGKRRTTGGSPRAASVRIAVSADVLHRVVGSEARRVRWRRHHQHRAARGFDDFSNYTPENQSVQRTTRRTAKDNQGDVQHLRQSQNLKRRHPFPDHALQTYPLLAGRLRQGLESLPGAPRDGIREAPPAARAEEPAGARPVNDVKEYQGRLQPHGEPQRKVHGGLRESGEVQWHQNGGGTPPARFERVCPTFRFRLAVALAPAPFGARSDLPALAHPEWLDRGHCDWWSHHGSVSVTIEVRKLLKLAACHSPPGAARPGFMRGFTIQQRVSSGREVSDGPRLVSGVPLR